MAFSEGFSQVLGKVLCSLSLWSTPSASGLLDHQLPSGHAGLMGSRTREPSGGRIYLVTGAVIVAHQEEQLREFLHAIFSIITNEIVSTGFRSPGNEESFHVPPWLTGSSSG